MEEFTIPKPPRTNYLNAEYGLKSWLLTKDHKRIALLYLGAISFFFFIGSLYAMAIRLELLSPQADLVHLACHAQFRPDNPLFSSLQLGDGWLTVRDTYKLTLNCGLVTLSACDTGVNAVAPGDELIGLARGFLSAGSPSVLLSLWTVDDEATAQLMMKFYEDLSNTESPSKSLRRAQIKLLEEKSHPFFWSPFFLVGRW